MSIEKFIRLFKLKTKNSKQNYNEQINALQHQINPHFLYNTLEAIRSEALICKQDEIAEMILALAEFFRYTISQKGLLVTFYDEMTSSNNYFKIQQFRFGERLEMKWDFKCNQESIIELEMPKLMMQPIIENAIYHGLEPKKEKGLITIQVNASTSCVFISIKDNGIGMSPDTWMALKKHLKNEPHHHKFGLALKNVHQRIQLLYGKGYGIDVKSVLDLGTEVTISLPNRLG